MFLKPYTLVALLFTFVFGHISSSHAVDHTLSLQEAVEQLEDRTDSDRESAYADAEHLLTKAINQSDQELILRLILYQAEVLTGLERLQDAMSLIAEYESSLEQFNRTSFDVRKKLILLAVADYEVDLAKSDTLVDEIVNILPQIEDQTLAASSYLEVGYSNYLNGKATEAIKNYEQAYQLYSKLGDEKGIAHVYNSTANVYGELGNSELALDYFKKALKVHQQNDDKNSMLIIHYNMGYTYLELDSLNEAKDQFLAAIEISKTLDDNLNLAYSKSALADVLVEQKNFEQALTLYKFANREFTKNNDERMMYSTNLGYFQALIALGNAEESTILYSKLKQSADKYIAPDYPSKFIRVTAQYFALLGDYQQAYAKQLKYTEFLSKYYKSEQQKGIEKLMIEFDSQVKDAENEILIRDNEVKQLTLTQQNSRVFFLVIIAIMSLAILIVIGFLLYRQIQHRTRYQKMALRDHLTNAPNRRAILQYGKERFLEAEQTNMNLTIAILDLDHFKGFNDKFGHDVGDEVLKCFSMSCLAALRKQDRYGRYGGEEWLFVLCDTEKVEVNQIFLRLRKHLNSLEIVGVPEDVVITFSMGVAQYDAELDQSLQNMINRADVNLYKAKDLGRDQCVQ